MKTVFGFIGLSFFLFSMVGCQPKADVLKEKAALFETDRQFAKMSADKGAAEAFKTYLAEDATELSPGANPVFGRDSIYKDMLEVPEGSVLEWEPQDGEVALSGDMGWTWGEYTYTWKNAHGEEAKSYGKYLNVWKKEEDGQWRVLIDMGNTSPAPLESNIP